MGACSNPLDATSRSTEDERRIGKMKYRKKPIVVEAFRLGTQPIPDWCMKKVVSGEIHIYGFPDKADIKTLEGTITANFGDFIIKGVNGEIYPCKPDIFEKTYEEVEGDKTDA